MCTINNACPDLGIPSLFVKTESLLDLSNHVINMIMQVRSLLRVTPRYLSDVSCDTFLSWMVISTLVDCYLLAKIINLVFS